MAKKYSIGPNASKGGDLGYINPDDLMDDLIQPVNALSINETSNVIKTPLGYFIIKRLK